MERSKAKRPGQDRYAQQVPEYYQAKDFFVGGSVEVNKFEFEIDGCDEYAYRYMENHPDEFMTSNINLIMSKLRSKVSGKGSELRNFCARNDPDATSSIAFDQARSLLQQCGANLVDHEIITICRHYALRSDSGVSGEKVLGAAQSELRKYNFDLFDKLSESAQHEDAKRSGRLMAEQLRVISKILRMPLANDLLCAVMEVTGVADDGSIDHVAFIRNLNWRDNPITCMETAIDQDEAWSETGPRQTVDRVRWQQLVDDLCGASQ